MFRFYIVEEGEARAYVLEDGEDVLMSHLGPGTKTSKTLPMLRRIVCPSSMSTLVHVSMITVLLLVIQLSMNAVRFFFRMK